MDGLPSFLVESKIICNQMVEISLVHSSKLLEKMFLYFTQEEMVLIGVNALADPYALLEEIAKYGDITNLKYILVQTLDVPTILFLETIFARGIQPSILSNETTNTISHNSVIYPYITLLYTYQNRLTLASLSTITFIPSPFVMTPNAYLIYLEESSVLFSGHLFSFSRQGNNQPYDINNVLPYHKENIPSSNFLHPLLSKIEKLNVSEVYTIYGDHLMMETITQVISLLHQTDFYNNNRYIKNTNLGNQGINYMEYANQVLHKLRNVYGFAEVLDVFRGSSIQVDLDTFEITSMTLEDYKIWHHLFEVIYVKKGVEWITILDPMVNAFHRLYQVEIPSVYKSEILDQFKKINELDQEKDKLKLKLKSTEDSLQAITEKMTHDPLTGLYNEMFLNEYLSSDLDLSINIEGNTREIELLFISIDNILEINAKYSPEIGDETIVNCSYLLNQIKQEEDILFKRKGPSFILYVHNKATRDIKSYTTTIQNKIRNADVFIENITVSIALVSSQEFPVHEDHVLLTESMLQTGENRIKMVYLKGPSSVIDQQTSIVRSNRGRILIVDHEEINLKLMKAFFVSSNFEIHTAVDGFEAFQIAKDTPIDVMIVNRNIPKLDGITLKQRLNESTFPMNILYFLITYKKTPEMISRSNQIGIDYVLEKPIIYEEILGLISREMKRRA